MSEPIVSVCLITYNHAKYIAQAIESVLMQQTNYEWELVIADDFSTDGTREIIKEYKTKYPEKIKLILQEKNVGANKNWIDLLSYPKSKYIAYFEGDDYWIDKNKLQKQIDFLESNPDYGMVHTGYKRLIEKKNSFSFSYTKQPLSDNIFDFLLNNLNCVATLTVCFRSSLFKDYVNKIDPINKSWKLGDLPLWLFIAKTNKVKFFTGEFGE
ncbi:MAG: glycosyltransferase [Bacteroidia bacterium]|nr:glycosyltransferase [Bacteroidia bacterium]